jgi:phosphomannomutase
VGTEPIISVSGLRGIIGDQLTPCVASNYTAAFATTLPVGGLVVIGRDGRASGEMLEAAIVSTLLAHGLDVAKLGPCATPTVGVQLRAMEAAAGIQISASHNPKEYNGLKLFGGDGRVLNKVRGQEVLNSYRQAVAKWVAVERLGRQVAVADAHQAHLELILKAIDSSSVAKMNFRVLLDSNHGAGALLGRRLLEALGCTVTVLGEEPDGSFAHPPEPIAENLTEVSKKVVEGGFDLGFCQDPDADRLAVIDENGKFIGEELTLALCLLQVLPEHGDRTGCVVTNCATSSVSRIIAEKFGYRCIQSAVGEANVADEMIAHQAVFGGEGNGGPIDPGVGYVRDSFVGMARILSLLAGSGQSISQLVSQMPPLAMVKDKISFPGTELPGLLDQLREQMADARPSTLDGLKLEWSDRWLLVRGSNTEPIVRLIAEAPSVSLARELCDRAKRIAESLNL